MGLLYVLQAFMHSLDNLRKKDNIIWNLADVIQKSANVIHIQAVTFTSHRQIDQKYRSLWLPNDTAQQSTAV